MKKLIFLALLALPLSAFTQTPQAEIATTADGNQIVSKIKDLEVTQLIRETSEFAECREKYTYAENDSATERNNKIKAAEKCFQDKLKNNSNPERLKQLSNALNLQTYRLVRSDNVKEIQNYLTDKMIEALTGVNPREQTPEQMKENLKFGKKKMVDQSLFIQLYKTQLGKNALFEISRFCFEDLRLNSKSSSGQGNDTFLDHWSYDPSLLTPTQNRPIDQIVAEVNDLGKPKYGASFSSTTDKTAIYNDILKSIQGTSNTDQQRAQNFLKDFFVNCGRMIVPLCNKFKNSTNFQTNNNQTTVTDSSSQVETETNINTTDIKDTPTIGSAACLAQSRIQEFKLALANADKVAKYFDEKMQGSSSDLSAFMKGLDGQPIKRFGDGSDQQEATIDELTNNSSSSILEGNLERNDEKIKECEESPELATCEDFIYNDDTLNKIKQKVELEMTLKREVEMARVRKLKEQSDQDLETYLKENGFLELLNDGPGNYKNLDKEELAKRVGAMFEAKKRATLIEINDRLGSRQVKDDDPITKPKAQELTLDTKEERARLAQVVMFNNIITSHLQLQRRDSSGNLSGAGRNVGAWRKEQEGLLGGQIQEDLFANLKAGDGDGANGGGIGRDAQIADFSLLDEILGKEESASGN